MRKNNKGSIFVLILLFLIIIGVVGYFGFTGFINYQKSPLDPNGKVKMFIIDPGESPQVVAERLEKEGFIRSGWAFLMEFKTKKDAKILAGDFKLSPSMSVADIITNLEQGSVDKRITLVEGWRVEEIANKLEKELGIENKEFLGLAKEGYMFPDTYFFNPDATADTIAQTLMATFDKRYDNEIKQKIAQKGLTTEEGVILASLVEREARSEKVRTEVAGIMLKRLNMGMKLDIDATVQYAKDTMELEQNGQIEKFWKSITQEDYSSVKSDYNTYLTAGLPPAPICNPSLSSLKAVANSDPDTPYLFYYHDANGNTYYAKTLEEHVENARNN